MYHISHDKRAKRSAELIFEGLLTCLRTRPFEEITVTDLQKACGVARTTFYRCFDNLSDVLFWQCDLRFQEALQSVTPADTPRESELIRGYFTYWTQHSEILSLLIDIDRLDIAYACHLKHAEELERSFGTLPDLDKTDARYFMAIRTGITVSVLRAWLEGGKAETTEELLAIIDRQLRLLKDGI